jgi:hypothetical protein
MRKTFLPLLITTAMIGCETAAPAPPVDRQGKLLTMAAAEAQQISDSRQRLSRQLNFAYEQLRRGKPVESRQSLAFAAQTLRDAKPKDLEPQIRIAGWVSISELSRAAADKPSAQTACDQAVIVLKTLEPVSDRPQFVVGVSDEVKALQGNTAAAALLESSVDWIKQMPGASVNRYALVAVAEAIFDCDDFEGGLAVLRADSDAAWRSDTLAMLAERSQFEPLSITQAGVADNATFRDANGNVSRNDSRGSRTLDKISNVGNGAVPGSVPATSNSAFEKEGSASHRFGKPVDFQSVFQQASH